MNLLEECKGAGRIGISGHIRRTETALDPVWGCIFI